MLDATNNVHTLNSEVRVTARAMKRVAAPFPLFQANPPDVENPGPIALMALIADATRQFPVLIAFSAVARLANLLDLMATKATVLAEQSFFQPVELRAIHRGIGVRIVQQG